MMDELLDFIRRTTVQVSCGDFEGMKEPTLAQLYQLKGLVEGTIDDLKSSKKE